MVLVHGRKGQRDSSFQAWLHSIPSKTLTSKVAIILDGSENMSTARSILLKREPKLQIVLLHAHLHDDKLSRDLDRQAFVLLSTEAFYKRSLGIRFDAVYDDCQVHRTVVESDSQFGLTAVLKTYIVHERELETRKQMAAKKAKEWGAFHPRATSVASCAEREPLDLQKRNAEACRKVAHPMLGFPLTKPKFRWAGDMLEYDGQDDRRDTLDGATLVNVLPLANLLFDAAEAESFSDVERCQLVALVCASQITTNLPRLFESSRLGGKRVKGSAVSAKDQARAREIAVSVVVRAFLSACGETSEAVGLVLQMSREAYVASERTDIPKVFQECIEAGGRVGPMETY